MYIFFPYICSSKIQDHVPHKVGQQTLKYKKIKNEKLTPVANTW